MFGCSCFSCLNKEVKHMTEYAIESTSVVVGLHEEKPIRVLHVDDESDLLKIAEQCLELEGPFIVDAASSVEEAMEKLKEKAYDVVVSDYQMPGKDGLQFLKELRANRNSIPFIIFTGRGREEVAIEALNLGASRYLNKTGDPATVYYELAHGIRQAVERNEAEERIRRSEEKYRNLFELAPDALVTLDMKGVITSCNAAALATSGYSRDEIVGKHFSKLGFLRIRDMSKYLTLFASTAKGNVPKPVRVTWHSKDGTPLVSEFHVGPIKEDSKTVGFQVTARDITERKKAEDALRESEEKYRDLFENAMDAILTLDLKGNITATNSSVLRFGYKKEDLVGKSILDFVSQEYLPTVMKDFSRVTQREPAKNETEIVVPTGKILVEYNARAIVKEGNVTGVQLNLRDVTERKKVEDAVRSSEAKLRAILASSPEAVSVSDLNGKLVDCNEAFLKLHGYFSKEELIGTSWFDVIAPVIRFKIQDTLRKLLEHGPIKNMEFPMLKKGSQEFVGELSASLVLDSSGLPTSIVVVARDITERKEMEEKLTESERRFRDLFENIQDPVGIFVGKEGHLIDYNTAYKRSSGYTDEELKGKVFLDFVHPNDHAMVLRKYKTKYSEKEFPLVYEIRGLNKKGESIPLELSVSPYKKKDRVIGIEVIHRDITDRKRAERTALENQQNFKALFAGNPEAAVHVGPDFCILDVNSRFEKLFGYKLDEIKGRNINEVVVPKNKIDEAQMLDCRAKQDKDVSQDTVRRKKDGSLVPVFVSAAPITIAGRFLGYVAVYKDISELKNSEKKLETMNEKLRVTGGLTRHDVRNKLSIVTGNVYLLKKQLADNNDILDRLRDIESAVQQATRIFDFAKSYEMLGAEELSFIDVAKTLDEAVSLFSGSINLKVVNECSGLAVLADSLFRQLFYNLIDNSLKYGKKVSKIRVHYEKAGQGQLKLLYEDDGVGISVAKKPKLFKEGYSTGGSTGYGLYLIKKITEVYSWTIEETGTPGRGAQFTITIPQANKHAPLYILTLT